MTNLLHDTELQNDPLVRTIYDMAESPLFSSSDFRCKFAVALIYRIGCRKAASTCELNEGHVHEWQERGRMWEDDLEHLREIKHELKLHGDRYHYHVLDMIRNPRNSYAGINTDLEIAFDYWTQMLSLSSEVENLLMADATVPSWSSFSERAALNLRGIRSFQRRIESRSTDQPAHSAR